MKTYHKSELAKLADVSYSTFYRFLKNRRTELDAMGINPNAQTFRGDGLKYICKEYNINLPEDEPEVKTHKISLKVVRGRQRLSTPLRNVVPL